MVRRVDNDSEARANAFQVNDGKENFADKCRSIMMINRPQTGGTRMPNAVAVDQSLMQH
jgi:hypothetical protein